MLVLSLVRFRYRCTLDRLPVLSWFDLRYKTVSDQNPRPSTKEKHQKGESSDPPPAFSLLPSTMQSPAASIKSIISSHYFPTSVSMFLSPYGEHTSFLKELKFFVNSRKNQDNYVYFFPGRLLHPHVLTSIPADAIHYYIARV